MSIARAATALLAALSLVACAPDLSPRAELSPIETVELLELLALGDRIEAELDERDALAARHAAERAPVLHASLAVATIVRMDRRRRGGRNY